MIGFGPQITLGKCNREDKVCVEVVLRSDFVDIVPDFLRGDFLAETFGLNPKERGNEGDENETGAQGGYLFSMTELRHYYFKIRIKSSVCRE